MRSTIHLDRLSDPGASEPVFCHLCGRTLVRGRCPEHSPRARRSSWTVAVLAALSITGFAFGIQAIRDSEALRDRLERVDSRLEDAADEITRLEDSLAAASDATQVVGNRIADVETKLKAVPDPTKVAETVLASVGTVVTPRGSKGSGFVFSSDGARAMLVTNFHVVEDVWDLGERTVTVRFGDRTYVGRIERVSTPTDLALVAVGDRLPSLTPSAEEAKEGQSVTAVGSPLDYEGTVTSGVVSAVRDFEGMSYLQISAPINPGNSGGPVVDAFGRVVGVVVAKRFGAEGVAFAIPVARVCSELEVGCP